ncbi:MAG: UDP-3-O-acyl-N-acetylglucosamine deacetylase [Planctomycetota bacterium]
MANTRQQRTISETVSLHGVGYWSGEEITVEFRPAAADSGLVFVRSDLSGGVRIPASPEYRVPVPRRTNLTQKGSSVEMVEHILAALAGMNVDNCEIHVSAAEMPALDGSCLAAVEAIRSVGTVELDAPQPSFSVSETIRVEEADCWIEARPNGGNGMSVSYELDYGEGPIGHQQFCVEVTPESFSQQLASARTFVLEEEANMLKSQGVGEHITYQDLLVFDQYGPIQNTLRFSNECVRHKMLDIVGDLALTGFDIHADIVARKSGHRHNTELAMHLLTTFRTACRVRQSA